MSNAAPVAIVTGASQGIGKAVATGLLHAGWNTVFVSRRLPELQQAIRDAGVVKATALALACDVSRSLEVDAVFSSAITAFGRVDLLFNNAGISGPSGTIDEIPLDEWEQTVEINLKGMFNCARAAFGCMKQQSPRGGRIINNGSIAAHTPRPRTVAYSVTKHAISGLTKCLSLDGREFDIACGQIDIGNAMTDLLAGIADRARAEGKPVPPHIDVALVADAVAQMAALPLSANTLFQTLMATQMPFVGRG